jgi:High potential iron-sulfur protein
MNRRNFMKMSGITAGLGLIPVYHLSAEEAPSKLSPDNPQAKALGYVEKSAIAGQLCSNSVQAKGDVKAAWLGCNLFPGKQVKAAGWCKVWSARA